MCISVGQTTISKTIWGAKFNEEVGDVVACSVLAIQSSLILAKSPDLRFSKIAPVFNTCLLNPTETY